MSHLEISVSDMEIFVILLTISCKTNIIHISGVEILFSNNVPIGNVMKDYKVKTQKGIDVIHNFGEMSETTAHVGDTALRVFLQKGFLEHDATTTNLHNHRYCEIHVVFNGCLELRIEGKRISLESGYAIAIPAGVYHSRLESSIETRVSAFQVEMETDTVKVLSIGTACETLRCEIAEYQAVGNSPRLALAVGLICSYFYKGVCSNPTPLNDREFIIYEFFANNYDKDVCLTDIAIQLRLSEKQAERLIIKSTGMSFRRLIVAKRIENAKMLVKTEGLSLAKAAERVGYQSYSGFWKALQSFEAGSIEDTDTVEDADI